MILKDFTGNASRVLQDFHQVIETEAHHQGISIASLAMLSGQLGNCAQTFKNVADQMLVAIMEM